MWENYKYGSVRENDNSLTFINRNIYNERKKIIMTTRQTIINSRKKRIGFGTVSLALSIISASFSFSAIGGKSLGEYFLEFLDVKFSISIISIVLFLSSVLLGFAFKEDYGAKAGRLISIVFLSIIILSTILTLVFFRS